MKELLYGDKSIEEIDKNSTEVQKEKFILVHVEAKKELLEVDDTLNELEELVKTSGGVVVARVTQNLDKQNSKHYVGKGKVDEIKDLITLHDADGIVCNHELSSVQLRVLNEMLDIRVLDRTQIVLDIFAQRASSKEGKLQVELAQLKYARAHIAGLGISMSRQGGGIGTRGPGEKKIETDRRLIDDRITDIQRELKAVVNDRQIRREAFSRLMYPLGLLRRLRKKAEYIWMKSTGTGRVEGEVGEEGCVVVPCAKNAEPITRFLARSGVKVVSASGRKIRDYVSKNSRGEVR